MGCPLKEVLQPVRRTVFRVDLIANMYSFLRLSPRSAASMCAVAAPSTAVVCRWDGGTAKVQQAWASRRAPDTRATRPVIALTCFLQAQQTQSASCQCSSYGLAVL